MDADNQYEIKGKNWYPCFKNPTTERDFMLEFNSEALKSGRIGLFILLIVWVGFAWFDLRLNDHVRSTALFFRLLIVTPLFLVILTALYSKYATAIYQILTCLTLFLIEGSIYYVVKFYDLQAISHSIGYDLPLKDADGKCIFIFIRLLIIFMASATVRLNILQSVLSGLIFIFFNILSIFTYQPSAVIVIIVVPFFIATIPVVWIESLHIQRYARENYRAAKLLSKYLAPQLTDTISAWQPDLIWKHARKKLTLFFSDIKDFTNITDSMEPEDMAGLLNEYLTQMTIIINKYNGTLAQIIGDGLYIFFGAPQKTSDKDHAIRCVKMAIDMQTKMNDLNTKWFDKGIDEVLKIRCGINTGMATVGGYGSSERKEYTAMGMQVNIAARLEQACEPGDILISHANWALVKDEISCTEKGQISIKGYHKPVRVYNVDIKGPGAKKSTNQI